MRQRVDRPDHVPDCQVVANMSTSDLAAIAQVKPDEARALIAAAKGSQAERAVSLGVSVATLQRLEKKLGIK